MKKAATKPKPETANRITANIIRVVNMQPGCSAIRVNSTGVWDPAKQLFRTSNGTKGVEDIICIIRGQYVGIEVKAGKDKQSPVQQQRQHEVERAKGIYFIARSTDEFLTFFQNLTTK